MALFLALLLSRWFLLDLGPVSFGAVEYGVYYVAELLSGSQARGGGVSRSGASKQSHEPPVFPGVPPQTPGLASLVEDVSTSTRFTRLERSEAKHLGGD